MAVIFPEYIPESAPAKAAPVRARQIERSQASDIGVRFEQMLWSEMLAHAGLEKAFTQTGGEAASAFSRYIVEAIAKDLAEKHPLGLTSSAQSGATSKGQGG